MIGLRLSDAQHRALKVCSEAGHLYRYDTDRWNWFRTFGMGGISKVATNPTIVKLKEFGLLRETGFGNVILTENGRNALYSLPQSVSKKAGT